MTSVQRLVQAATCQARVSRMECRRLVMLRTVPHRCYHHPRSPWWGWGVWTRLTAAPGPDRHAHRRPGRPQSSRRSWSNLRCSELSWLKHYSLQAPSRPTEIMETLDIAESGYGGASTGPRRSHLCMRVYATYTEKSSVTDRGNQTQTRYGLSTVNDYSNNISSNNNKSSNNDNNNKSAQVAGTVTTSSDSAVNNMSGTGTGSTAFKIPDPELNWAYIINPENETTIQANVNDRKGVGDLQKVKKLWNSLTYPEEIEVEGPHSDLTNIKQLLMKEALELPNLTHPDVPIGDESKNIVVETVGTKRVFNFQPKSVVQLGEELGMLRTQNLGHTSGPKTYYLIGGLAHLEEALVRYTVDTLEKHGFTVVSVPDLIHPDIVERCGFKVTGDRTQVYKLDPRGHGQVALAGTGEMPIAGMFMGQRLDPKELPKKVVTVSRCYRAETSDIDQERGIYRVHQFTKVEAFGVTSQENGNESEELLSELLTIQKSLFKELGIHFRVLHMASQELGAPAYRKYDMETWMPAKQFWGEISSTSNCIDYQSRRLCIRYGTSDASTHAHTVNGTACAVPRMIMAILENNQLEDGRVEIPNVLHPYMGGLTVLEKDKYLFTAMWIKFTKLYKSRLKSP